MTIKKIPLEAVAAELLQTTVPTVTNTVLNAGLSGTTTIALTGTNFAAGMTVVVDQTVITNVTVNTPTSATVVVPAKAYGVYPFYVYNVSGSVVAYKPGIIFSDAPIWLTPAGSLGSAYELVNVANTTAAVAATSRSTVTYNLYSGLLPPGTSLNASTGVISGTTTSVATATTYTFTIIATNVTLDVATRTFSIIINPDVVTWVTPAAGDAVKGLVRVPFSYTLVATSAAGLPITYTADILPDGLSVVDNTIFGIPNAISFITTYVTAASSSGKLATRNFPWIVFSLPDAPTIVTAARSASNTVQVAYTAPASNGGTAILSYTAVSTPDEITSTVNRSGSGVITVGGLTNGVAYTFKVYATNQIGDGNRSADSNSATPYTVASAPTIVSATRSASQTVQIVYTVPLNDGGSPITSYTATSSPEDITGTVNQSESGTVTVSSLTNGVPYTFTVVANNAAGASAASQPSGTVTPYTIPRAPTIGTATATGGRSASISYTAPTDNGGTAITSYTAVSSPGGITGTVSQSGSGTITVTGLTPNTSYTFTVYATNPAGNSTATAASNSITTATVPGAPTIGTAAATSPYTATVTYTAPASNGGAVITSYTAVSSPGGITGTVSQSGSGTITVSGLSQTTSYTFTVYATNDAGDSASSAASSNNTTTLLGTLAIELLMVGGGGGGANWGGGGGGAGGLLYYGPSTPKTPNGAGVTVLYGQPINIVIGAGNGLNSSGGDTTFVGGSHNLTAIGGGSGGSSHGATARVGGSGGGGTWSQAAVAGTAGQGNRSGNSGAQDPYNFEGGLAGGGGAGGVGGNGANGSGGAGGAGGAGLRYTEYGAYGTDASNSIVPTSGKGYFASGGGGGGCGGVVAATAGGGGAGGYGVYGGTRIGQNAKANTGGGGGGTGDLHRFSGGNNVGSGGSGIVLIRYQGSTVLATGGTIDTTSNPGYVIHTFTAGGTFSI
jgi:hypothetical protein